MTWLRRGLLVGAGFGLAAAAADVWYEVYNFVHLRMGPGPLVLARNALVLIALGAAAGGSGALALRSPGRAAPFLHLCWVCGFWLAVERWLAIDTLPYARGTITRAVAASAVVLMALVLQDFARRYAALPWILAGIAAIAGLAAPSAYLAATMPPPSPRAALPPAREGAPDVLFVVMDTVRADSVASYGHARDTTPNFDALAREGALFLDATSPSTWSLPSHASLFTGRYPTSHGAFRQASFLDDRFPTLAEVLTAHGYETLCFTANPHISDGLGLTRGFAVEDLSWKLESGFMNMFASLLLERFGLGDVDKGGRRVAANYVAWLRARTDGPPRFVFLNFLEAHVPYDRIPSEFRDRYSSLPPAELRRISRAIFVQATGGAAVDVSSVATPARDLYDGGVAYTDALLGRVIDALRASGRLDRTVLVVLADHGEMLGERGGYFGHSMSLYQRMIHVPLLVRYPPRIARGTRVEQPVSTLGVFATILDLAGIEPPPTLQAGSLWRDGAATDGEAVLSEAMAGVQRHGRGTDPQIIIGQSLRAYRAGPWKLVQATMGGPYLYDLARDPTEARDLAAERPEQVAKLAVELEAVRVRLGLPKLNEARAGAAAPALDEATQQRLRELGYLK